VVCIVRSLDKRYASSDTIQFVQMMRDPNIALPHAIDLGFQDTVQEDVTPMPPNQQNDAWRDTAVDVVSCPANRNVII
jgi:hypothetical protein